MNLKELANHDNLVQLAQNPETLNDYINQSQGYILQLMKEFNVLPELSVLMAQPNLYALSFIENNYVLDSSEKKTINKILKNNSEPKKKTSPASVKEPDLTQEKFIEYLVNEIPLPSQVAFPATMKLDYEVVIQYRKEIEKQYALNSGIKNLLRYAFVKYSAEEMLAIDKEFIWQHPELLEMDYVRMVHLKNPEFAQLYRDTMLNNYHTANLDKFRMYDFNNNDEDKKLFDYLMNSADFYNRHTYTRYTKMNGDHDYYTREEYLTKFAPHDISDWEDEYLLENQDLLRSGWKKILIDEERQSDERYNHDNHFLTEILGHLKPEICQQIFNKEMIELFLKHNINIFFDWDEEDDSYEKMAIYENIRTNRNWLEQQMFEMLKKKPELLNKEMVFQWSSHIDTVDGKDYLSTSLLSHCLKNENLVDFMRYITNYTDTPGFYEIESHQKTSNYYPGHALLRKNISLIDEMIENEPSINLLFLLMNELAFIEKHGGLAVKEGEFYQKLLTQNQQLASSLDEKDVNLLKEFFSTHPQLALPENHGIQGIKSSDLFSGNENNKTHNFLNFRTHHADKNMQALLFFTNPQYPDYLLSDEFDEKLSDRMLMVLFKQMKMDFLKQYMLKHPEILLNNEDDRDSFVFKAKCLPIERLIFQWDDGKEKQKIEKFFKEYKKFIDVDKKIRYNEERTKWDNHHYYCQSLLANIPYRYLKETYKDLLNNHQFSLLNHMDGEGLLKIFPSYQLGFQQFMDRQPAKDMLVLLANPDFSQLMHHTESRFSTSYNKEENYLLAQKKLSINQNKKADDEKESKNEAFSIACSFMNSNKDFFNQFLVNYLPEEIFAQDYDFHSSHMKDWAKNYPFSVTELIQAYENIKNQNNLSELGQYHAIRIISKDIADFAKKYWNNESGQQVLKQFMDYAKNNDSMLYAVLNSNAIYEQTYGDKKEINNRIWSEKYVDFIYQAFSENSEQYAVLIDGYEKILAHCDNSVKRSIILPAMETLDNIHKGLTEKASVIEINKAQELIAVVYDNSPLLTLHQTQFCSIDNKNYQKNWIRNNQETFINRLLFDNEDLAMTYKKNTVELSNLLDMLFNPASSSSSKGYYHAQYLNYLLDTSVLFKECKINDNQIKDNQILDYLVNSAELSKKIKSAYMFLKLDSQITSSEMTEEESPVKLKI